MELKTYIIEAKGQVLENWKIKDTTDKKIICQESIENIDKYFPEFISGIKDYKIVEKVSKIETTSTENYTITELVTQNILIKNWSLKC